jgi:GAF domain-containing protein
MTAPESAWPPDPAPEPVDLVLLALARRLDAQATVEGMYAVVDEELARLIAIDRIAIGKLDTTSRRITLEYDRGASLGLPERYTALPSDRRSLIHTVVHEGRPVLHTVDPERDVFRGDPVRRRHGMWQALVTPIVQHGAVTGLIMLNSSEPDRYTADTVRLVETASRMLGMALGSLHRVLPDQPGAADQVFTETMGRIAFAESIEQVLADLYLGIDTALCASVLRFSRRPDGAYVFEEARQRDDFPASDQAIDELGAELAARLPALIDADVGVGTVPQRAIFTDLPLADRSIARVHGTAPLADLLGTGPVAIAPLHAAREILGALAVVWPETTAPDRLPGYARLFFNFSDMAGPAIHRLILRDRLERRIAETETIRRLTDSVARTPRFQDALDVICRTSQLVTGHEFVAIAETAADHLIWRSASGARDRSFLHRRMPVPLRVIRTILESDQEVILDDVRRDPEFSPELMPVHIAEGLRSTAVIPVYVNARLRAAMIFATRRLHAFTPEEVMVLHSLAATVATAIASNDARMRDVSGT